MRSPRSSGDDGYLAASLGAIAPVEAATLRAPSSVSTRRSLRGRDAGRGCRCRTQTAALAGSFAAAVAEARRGNAAAAQQWLLVRGFEGVTRYSHPDAAATVAVRSLKDGVISNARAGRAIEVDLLDTYESLLRAALADTGASTRTGYPGENGRRGGDARGYWTIIRPAYVTQRGHPAAKRLDGLSPLSWEPQGDNVAVRSLTDQARYDLLAFRAAPLAEAEQARRAGQLTRFLGLIPIEYARGVAGGAVTVPIEIQEAIIFRDGAANAFGDLQSYLASTDAASTRSADSTRSAADAADRHRSGHRDRHPGDDQGNRGRGARQLDKIYPDAWKGDNAQADFDVIATLLQKVGASVAPATIAVPNQAASRRTRPSSSVRSNTCAASRRRSSSG